MNQIGLLLSIPYENTDGVLNYREESGYKQPEDKNLDEWPKFGKLDVFFCSLIFLNKK